MTQQRQRRRPMSREEARALEERKQRQREREQESRELARGPIDLPFCVLVVLLSGIGLVMLLSASFPSAYYETDGKNPMFYFMRQGVFAAMGIAAMLLIGQINYQRFRALAQPLLFLSVILLILVLIPHNPIAITRNNATRWLGIPGTSLQFQPSEIAKVAVVVYFADSISKKKDRMRTFRYGILPYAIILVVLAALVGLEPHLSGAILSWVAIVTELSSSIILYNNKSITLTMSTYVAISRGNYGLAAAFAAILTVVTTVSLLLYLWVSKSEDVSL